MPQRERGIIDGLRSQVLGFRLYFGKIIRLAVGRMDWRQLRNESRTQLCRQDRPRQGGGSEGDAGGIKTMDSVIGLGEEVRERDQSVMCPGSELGRLGVLGVPPPVQGI